MPRSHQTFSLVPTVKLLGIMFRNRCWPHHFSHYYNRRCRRMVSKLAGVINPSCPDHIKLLCPVPAMKLWGICWELEGLPTTFHITTIGDADGWCQNWPVWSTPHALITPNFLSNSSYEIVGDYAKNQRLAHHYSHYYNRRYQRMVLELVGVINPPCPDHTKFSVHF
jgi:hypothetical protein